MVLLSRDEAHRVRELVTVAPISTRMRRIPTEAVLGRAEGMPRRCAVNLDSITTLPKRTLARRITTLPALELGAVDRALRFALGLVRGRSVPCMPRR